jgi:hypothetical protein|nr:MAG TPA: ligase [Caudoviricetes sp.]
MKLGKITIGADPELFIINEKTKKVVSSVGKIPGEKGNPYVAEDMPSGFGLETDNILAEFNIPPVSDEASFVNNIEYMKQYIDKFVKNLNPDYGILCAASKTVDKNQLQSPQAQLFGCDVDYNAYTEAANPKPEGSKTNLRSAGFHIHIGYENPNIDASILIVKYLDMYLGVPSVIYDKDKRRRSLYGKAGCFRLTSYGVEYRVLSSAMMKDVETLQFVWRQVQKALAAASRGGRLIDSTYVVRAINDSDADLAQNIVKTYNIM